MPEGKAPPIGRLRNYAEVFEWQDIPFAANSEVRPAYTSVGKCWCSLKARGDQMLGAAQVVEQSGIRGTHIIRTRFREDLSTRHMLEINGQRFRVVAVRPDDARRFVELEAEYYGDASIIAPQPPPRYWDRNEGGSLWDNGNSIWDNQPIP